MRLLYVTDRLSHKGGAPHHLLDVIRAMAPRHSVRVAAGAIDADIDLPVECVRVRGLAHITAGTAGLSGLEPLLATADVVHAQNLMNPIALERIVATGRALVTVQDHRMFCPGPGRTLPDGTPCDTAMSDVACTRCLPDTDYRRRLLSLTQGRLEALAGARVLVLSRYMASELHQAGVGDVSVLPPPVAADPKPSDAGSGFLLAGRLVRHKGVDLAHAAWVASKTELPLRIAGAGTEGEHLDGADHLGWLTRDALRMHMRQARALLFPSRWQEPFGIIGAEALAVGTPVIAMSSGGMADWAQTGCYMVKAGDVKAMAAAIQTLGTDPDKAQAMGAEGWAWVRDYLDPEALHGQLEGHYADIS